ncbi:aminotransferase class V-fold PLP-dependent enzyme [Pacificibacter marinus]|uniref:Putative cysteine desulfurase n=1 Tax=Pacificibacter marinus TaxID=658057 RepID=A0A1Y5RFW1_9RHOB|nr:aminotransferase class V-fold PLP-dependent enzyme [Pacificibacter marinus]SEK21402.1 Selenocysteine lyase/Cysteine desulfurase [Pacificibacter marinus]SLN16245.1 putative cysteine desulfurase [Pacificibacter marinus]
MSLDKFRASIETPDTIQDLQAGLIGDGTLIPGLFGDVPLVYADYVASGRALEQVEDYIRHDVLPFYANSHTEASYCGSFMTRLRNDARAEIAKLTGAGDEHVVVFTGSGATTGLNKLVKLLGVDTAANPVVFIGPYEHHSNILPWRESKATVIEIPEAAHGGPDLDVLRAKLAEHSAADVKIGSFSAASNVTGIVTDPVPVTKILKDHGALSVWDYAGGGPYLEIDMSPCADAQIDAAVVSPHKFVGGPGASGVLILRKDAVTRHAPTSPGGGTVTFVSSWTHEYTQNISSREEAGTPNVIGDIRAALAFIVKDVVSQSFITAREHAVNVQALSAWGGHPQLTLLSGAHVNRLPIFSFLVSRKNGARFHHQLFTRMLSDIYGIQVRGGCACAGPYAHALLKIDEMASAGLLEELRLGNEINKPGWVRLNFSYLMSDVQVQFILESVLDLLNRLEEFEAYYDVDTLTARFSIKQNRTDQLAS